MSLIKIGIDFDNTIVCYDNVFHQAALQKKIIPQAVPTFKNAVRDFLRSTGKEDEWTRLQGYVYGAGMDLATSYTGVDAFFELCKKKRIPTCIISHKTQFPFLGPKYDLHASATSWLKHQTFSWVPAFFEVSLEEKLKKISSQQCNVFIDDLPELLAEKKFPSNVQKVLFDPNGRYSQKGDYIYARSWDEIINKII